MPVDSIPKDYAYFLTGAHWNRGVRHQGGTSLSHPVDVKEFTEVIVKHQAELCASLADNFSFHASDITKSGSLLVYQCNLRSASRNNHDHSVWARVCKPVQSSST